MAVNVTDYFTKFQQEGLRRSSRARMPASNAMSKFRALGNEFADKPGTIPTFENLPTPTQLVEMSFGFATQMLEVRKAYTLKVAEMFVDAQKTAEATVKNTVNQANVQMNQAVAQAKTVQVSFPRERNKAARHSAGRLFSLRDRLLRGWVPLSAVLACGDDPGRTDDDGYRLRSAVLVGDRNVADAGAADQQRESRAGTPAWWATAYRSRSRSDWYSPSP